MTSSPWYCRIRGCSVEQCVKTSRIRSRTSPTKQIEDACKAVGLHHYIMSLPNGYDTVLDDKATLSQGQKQLLTIARAMVEDAPILILDEATSSVDTRTEELIQKAMDALTVDRTSFVTRTVCPPSAMRT